MCIFELINVRVIGTDAHLNSIRRQVLTTVGEKKGQADGAGRRQGIARRRVEVAHGIDRFERHGVELQNRGSTDDVVPIGA